MATLVVSVVAADLGAAGRVHVEHLAVADGAKLLLEQLGERGECLFVGGGHGSPFLGAPGWVLRRYEYVNNLKRHEPSVHDTARYGLC